MMGERMSKAEFIMHEQHLAVLELLPWYVNGTLDAAEKQQVQVHLKQCLVCRDALQSWQFTAECARLGTPASRFEENWNRLMGRIKQDRIPPASRQPIYRKFLGLKMKMAYVWRNLSDAQPVLKGLFAVQLAALVALFSVVIIRDTDTNPQLYRTLSEGDGYSAAASGKHVHLVFTADALEVDVRRIVNGVGGNIIGGPGAVGVYTVILKEDTAALMVEKLKSEPKLVFVSSLPSKNE